jgi:hypothetical protein
MNSSSTSVDYWPSDEVLRVLFARPVLDISVPSRPMTRQPSWAQLRGRNYGSAGRPITGMIRTIRGNSEDVERFWFSPKSLWRIERADGVVMQVQSPDRTFLRADDEMQLQAPNTWTMWGGGHASQIVRAYQIWGIDDDHVDGPVNEPQQVEIGGRTGWQVQFTDRSGAPLVAVIDDETGLVLRLEMTSSAVTMELIDFELDADIAPEAFEWDGPYTEQADRVADEQQRRRDLTEIPLPIPAFWPGGLQAQVLDGDPATGAVMVELHSSAGQLARWPLRAKRPDQLDYESGHRHVFRWKDEQWNWVLRTSQELSTEELERVKASIPQHHPRRTAGLDAAAGAGSDPSGGRGRVRAFDGRINVGYGQFYVQSDDLVEPGHNFAGQSNGLCGAAEPGMLYLIAGTHTGTVGLTVDLCAAEPAADDSWEEIVEASLTVQPDTNMLLFNWDGNAVADLPLSPGQYRVRYCGNNMDAASDTDAWDGADNYQLSIWPAPEEPDRVIRQTSQIAAYWHTAWQTD